MTMYLIMLFISGVVAYVVTGLARVLSRRVTVKTPIRARDVHSEAIPRLGGIGIFAGFAVGLLVASKVYFVSGIFEDTFAPWGILLGALIVMVVGVIDDLYDLRWFVKLFGQTIAALVVALWGVRLTVIPFVPAPLEISSRLVAVVLTVFLILVSMNAVNFVDGLDGLAAGVTAIGGAAFFICTYWVHRHALLPNYSDLATLLMALMVGACIGFLPHNRHPAKIFMGDSGAMLLGLLMASGALVASGQIFSGLYNRANGMPAFMPVILPIAILMVPLLDLGLAVVRRTTNGKSPFSADRGHLHHKLLDLGFSHANAVYMMYLWAFVLAFGGAAYAFFPWQLVSVILGVAIVALLVLTLRPAFSKSAQGQRNIGSDKGHNDQPNEG